MKLSKVIFGAVIFVGIQVAAVASPFSITCQTFNLATGQLTSVFFPGERVMLVVTPTFNDATARGKAVTITLNAKATVSGVSIPYAISNAASVPNSNPGSLRNPELFSSGQQIRSFKIPRMLPPSTLTVSALATITSVGSATCSTRITVR
jgi:hypothetical protein